MTIDFDRYQARVTAATLATILPAWSWLPLRGLRAVGVSLFGDVFFVDESGGVHVLDVSFGVLEQVAASSAAFGARLQEPAFAEAILRVSLAEPLLAHTALEPDHVQTFVHPLIGGGPATLANIAAVHVGASHGILAQLTQQLAQVPVGARFAMRFEGFPGDVTAPPPADAVWCRTARIATGDQGSRT